MSGEAGLTKPVAHGLAYTPPPPYYAVIFTSVRADGDEQAYASMAATMDSLAAKQPGYLGIESVRAEDGAGITVSYWASEESIRNWKAVTDPLAAQRMGREKWYRAYTVRVAKVERAYGFTK